MAHYAPPPDRPDGRVFASYPMPAKIDLIQERPRRESLIERQLEHSIGQPAPNIQVTEVKTVETTYTTQQQDDGANTQQQQFGVRQAAGSPSSFNHQTNQQQQQQQETIRQSQSPAAGRMPSKSPQQNQAEQNQRVGNRATGVRMPDNAAILAADLAQKEAKLMAEIQSLHQRPYSPFQVPSKIDLTQESRKLQLQQEHAPSPRPYSRASSTRSTCDDLLDKEAKLLQEIEEMERKPFNPQRMVVEREQWFEYPQGQPTDRQLLDSKRRVKDFCSMPSHMYQGQGTHIHEENLPTSSIGRPTSAASNVHTTIIRSPRREVDNKSPLPFAFDNFTTKGVRGNIASAGAIEPDRPRPPIYPIMKRSVTDSL